MFSKADAMIALVSIAAGMIALESSHRVEITPDAPAPIPLNETSADQCVTEYQGEAAQRMVMRAFGIPVTERRGLESTDISCANR